MERMRKLIDHNIRMKYNILMKRCQDLESALLKQKTQSSELQKEVTKLNMSLDKAAAELQNINKRKVSSSYIIILKIT